ncbi:hypothetical protein ACQZ61_18505 [Agrobacterium vitis]|uniref:hypothetical protein n=1 Tax=Agrobacterium vitis TaxID=373 RepID=UPI0015DAEDA8|nr:hypothetical protein [Agrobacterium vitis]MCF1451814.1 hypothetical protein [Agrobacterium vitis]
MSGLETAIRSALDRSERSRAEVRARIYQSARQALEAGLKKQNVNDPETVAEQRHRLEATIHAIEQQERARLKAEAAVDPVSREPVSRASVPPPISSQAMAPPLSTSTPPRGPAQSASADTNAPDNDSASLSFGVDRDHGRPTEPSLDLEDVRAERHDRADPPGMSSFASFSARPASMEPETAEEEYDEEPARRMRAEPVAKPRRRRGVLSRLLISVTLLSSLGIAAWWVYSTGLLLSPAQRQTGAPSPTPTASSEDFNGDQPTDQSGGEAANEPKTIDPQRGFSNDWIEAFQPDDTSKIKVRPNATAEVVGASDGQAVHIVSRSTDMDGTAAIEIAPDLLRQMAGGTSTIALTVQSFGEKPVQFSLSCAFDRLGDCARHRFTANPEKADLLFRVNLSNGVAPNAPGQLLINADISGQGNGINLYAVRVLPGK